VQTALSASVARRADHNAATRRCLAPQISVDLRAQHWIFQAGAIRRNHQKLGGPTAWHADPCSAPPENASEISYFLNSFIA